MSGRVTLYSPNDTIGIQYCDSSELTLVAINPIKGFREDSNVLKYRTFLWEIDTGPLQQQIDYIKNSGIPISAWVFSGNKSVHAVTVLDQDVQSDAEYREMYQWALRVLTMCDQNCKNPSRSVRIPGAYREPGKKQRLIKLENRIPIANFRAWLDAHSDMKPQKRQRKPFVEGEENFDRLSPWAQINLSQGIDFRKGRNRTWYALAYDLALAGYSEETAIETLGKRFYEERDFKEKELLITIASAYKHAEEDK